MSGQENSARLEGAQSSLRNLGCINNYKRLLDICKEKNSKKAAFAKVRKCLLAMIQREDVDSQKTGHSL